MVLDKRDASKPSRRVFLDRHALLPLEYAFVSFGAVGGERLAGLRPELIGLIIVQALPIVHTAP
tara:strand:- start:23005 stop:23196 length:192 start_codon:yes stop_codon:yes gene_type:complete